MIKNFLLLLLSVFSLSVEAQTESANRYVYALVTSADQITDDGVYLIGRYTTNNGVYLMTNNEKTVSSQKRLESLQLSGTTNDGKVPPANLILDKTKVGLDDLSTLEYKISKNTSGYYNITNFEGKYLSRDKTNLVFLSSANATNSAWAITLQTDKPVPYSFYFQDKEKTSDSKLGLIGSSSNYSAFYIASGSTPPHIYKKTEAYAIKIGSTGYATFYDSQKDAVVPYGMTALTYCFDTQSTGLRISENYNGGDRIPANSGVVLKGEKNTDYILGLCEHNASFERDENNVLKGTDESKMLQNPQGDKKFYKLSRNSEKDDNSVGFYWGAENGGAFTNGAHKAYLEMQFDIQTGAKAMSFELPDDDIPEITGIEEVGQVPLNHHGEKAGAKSDAVYDLFGRRVSAPGRGVYIVNGRKVLLP